MNRALEQLPQKVTVSEAAMAVLREGGMVWYISVQSKTQNQG